MAELLLVLVALLGDRSEGRRCLTLALRLEDEGALRRSGGERARRRRRNGRGGGGEMAVRVGGVVGVRPRGTSGVGEKVLLGDEGRARRMRSTATERWVGFVPAKVGDRRQDGGVGGGGERGGSV